MATNAMFRPTTAVELVGRRTALRSLNLSWNEESLPQGTRTKHVHGIHPYLGKFVPQIAETFLKKYQPERVCDPFAGSGTTLVEAVSLGIDSIGIDVSSFNCLLQRVKSAKYENSDLERETEQIVSASKAIIDAGKLRMRQSYGSVTGGKLSVDSRYLREWYHPDALTELMAFHSLIADYRERDFFNVVLTRAARSARRAPHYDLDFPKHPVSGEYFCFKHSRKCKPTKHGLRFIERYARDNLRRVGEFSKIRAPADVQILNSDSRTIKVPSHDLILTSPPYLGMIDYHEQHRYAYELLGLRDHGESEIGLPRNGTSQAAREAYVDDMVAVFRNVARSLGDEGRVVIVVADTWELYPMIRQQLGAREVGRVERTVERRTGRRSTPFRESILVWRLA